MPSGGTHPTFTGALHGIHDPIGVRVVAETDEDLIEHDVIDYGRTLDRREVVGEAPSERTVSLDQFGNARAAKLAQRCPGGKATCSA
jgi:hypothetical protein